MTTEPSDPTEGLTLADVDVQNPDVFQQGRHHAMFAVLRRDAPVHFQTEPDGRGFWCITKHADLSIINRDYAGFSSSGGINIPDADEAQQSAVENMMLYMDPPRHTRYRLLVNKGFTPRMIGQLEDSLRLRTRAIVNNICEKGECDFVEEIAAELPLQAIADLMGVPQEDRKQLFEWSNRMVGFDDPEFQGSMDDGLAAAAEMYVFFNALAADRRRDPKADIVTTLVNAEIEGDRLTEEEFDMFSLLLTVAGNETTRNATAHGMKALIDHPAEYAKLSANTSRETLDRAVEEILRWATPVLHFRRTATADVELRGQQIKEGDKVVMWHISANRDEEVFDDPMDFRIDRWPNEQLAFGGGGPHFCLGTNLARMELRLIFEELATRIPDMTMTSPPEMLRSNFIGGIKRMPVKFTPSRPLAV